MILTAVTANHEVGKDPTTGQERPPFLTWTMNQPIPGDNSTKIRRIVRIDDAIEVFAEALPSVPTQLPSHAFRIWVPGPKVLVELLPMADWQQAIQDADAASQAQEADRYAFSDEEDDEGEEEEPANGSPQGAAPLPPKTLGSGSFLSPHLSSTMTQVPSSALGAGLGGPAPTT